MLCLASPLATKWGIWMEKFYQKVKNALAIFMLWLLGCREEFPSFCFLIKEAVA